MSQDESTELSYTKNWEIGIWHYIVDANPNGVDLYNPIERAPWLASIVSSAFAALTGFAEVNSISIGTDAKGENCYNLKAATAEDLSPLEPFLVSTADVSDIHALLSLCCVQLNAHGLQQEFFLHNKGRLYIANNISKHGDIEDGLIRVSFSLESDIYSPIAEGDNRTLAALNAPRLRKFLRLMEEIPSLRLDEIDDPLGYLKRAEKYGVVDRYGFKMPDDPHKFEEMLKRESGTN